MPEINPYEAPQEDSRRELPRPNLKPPAFWLAVIVQALCLSAALATMSAVGNAPRRSPLLGLRDYTLILLAFAALMGVGIIASAHRYGLQGWVAGETLLLIFMMLLFFAK